MNFAAYKEVAIPEGVVTQIADASGRVIWKSGPPLIEFTIDGTKYQAEAGMTWNEWCDSDYDQSNIYSGSGIYVSHMYTGQSVVLNGAPVSPNDVIVGGAAYTLAGGQGGFGGQ